MLAELIQILFTFIGALIGLFASLNLSDYLAPFPEYYSYLLVVLIFTSAGFLLGYFISRRLDYIFKTIDEILSGIPGIDLIIGSLGLLVGLVIGLLISIPFFDMPYGKVYTLVSFFVFGFIGLFFSLSKSRELAFYILGKRYFLGKKVVDTSALIDGRILGLLRLNLLEGVIIIPEEVIAELQKLADSDNVQVRKKGQRGLKNLNELNSLYEDRVVIYPLSKVKMPVDDLLLEVCHKEGASLVTSDSNLVLVARAKGITAVNLNELLSELKVPVDPGDIIDIEVVRQGKGKNQAVGYLDDGTMVVVENAADQIGRTITVEITGLTYSSTGKVLFARQKEKS